MTKPALAAERAEWNARAGWDVRAWCRAAGISRALYYDLPAEYQPASTKVRDRRIILEPAREWLERIARAGGVPAKTSKTAA